MLIGNSLKEVAGVVASDSHDQCWVVTDLFYAIMVLYLHFSNYMKYFNGYMKTTIYKWYFFYSICVVLYVCYSEA